MKLPILFSLSLFSFVLVACSNKQCFALACSDGISVMFSDNQPGKYVVDVTVDGTKTTCTASLPIDQSENDEACIAGGIILTRSGSMLPAAEQSIGGLEIRNTNAKSVSVRVVRDGIPLHDATFSPSYLVTPEPNGPDCDPKECRSASFKMP